MVEVIADFSTMCGLQACICDLSVGAKEANHCGLRSQQTMAVPCFLLFFLFFITFNNIYFSRSHQIATLSLDLSPR